MGSGQLEFGIGQNNLVNVYEKRNNVCILDRRVSRMGAMIPVLEIHLDKPVGFVAVEQLQSLADLNQVGVKNSLQISQRGDHELLFEVFVPTGVLLLHEA